ncbi:hypothetical protein D3C74_59270 [compost metagenome]
MEQATFVPIRTVTLLPDLKVSWDNTLKKVTVSNSKTQEQISLTIGNKEASKGNEKIQLTSPARMVEGTTYVPLRFIGEAFGAVVKWDPSTKSVAIYNSDPVMIASLNSQDLTTARTAALKLPRISFHEPFATPDESHSTTYIFPFGEVKRFFISNQGVIQYLEIHDNAAWVKWEGVENVASTGGADVIPNIVQAVSKERGNRPQITGKLSYFTDMWMMGQVSYGTIDERSTSIENGRSMVSGSDNVVMNIPGEQRVSE